MIIFKFFNRNFVNGTKILSLQPVVPRKCTVRGCNIRRSLFYVPCDDKKKIEKAMSLSVDCLAFDLSLVHNDNKGLARENVTALLNEGNMTKINPEWCVKLNSIQTGNDLLCDIEAIFSSHKIPPAIILPGVDDCHHLKWFSEIICKKYNERSEEKLDSINLILVVGSAKSIMRLPDICQRAQEMADSVPITPVALVFDNDSLSDTLGTIKTTHGVELLYARQKFVLVAKAYGLQAIDMVNRNPTAVQELKNECKEAYILGFTGKQVLYPNHIPVIHSEFSPTRSKIKRAQTIINQFKKREKEVKKEDGLSCIPLDPDTLKTSEDIINAAKASGKSV